MRTVARDRPGPGGLGPAKAVGAEHECSLRQQCPITQGASGSPVASGAMPRTSTWTNGRGSGTDFILDDQDELLGGGGHADHSSGGETLSPTPCPAYRCGIAPPDANPRDCGVITFRGVASGGIVAGEVLLAGPLWPSSRPIRYLTPPIWPSPGLSGAIDRQLSALSGAATGRPLVWACAMSQTFCRCRPRRTVGWRYRSCRGPHVWGPSLRTCALKKPRYWVTATPPSGAPTSALRKSASGCARQRPGVAPSGSSSASVSSTGRSSRPIRSSRPPILRPSPGRSGCSHRRRAGQQSALRDDLEHEPGQRLAVQRGSGPSSFSIVASRTFSSTRSWSSIAALTPGMVTAGKPEVDAVAQEQGVELLGDERGDAELLEQWRDRRLDPIPKLGPRSRCRRARPRRSSRGAGRRRRAWRPPRSGASSRTPGTCCRYRRSRRTPTRVPSIDVCDQPVPFAGSMIWPAIAEAATVYGRCHVDLSVGAAHPALEVAGAGGQADLPGAEQAHVVAEAGAAGGVGDDRAGIGDRLDVAQP